MESAPPAYHASIDAGVAAISEQLAEAWPAVCVHLDAGRPDKAADVIHLAVDLLWKRLALARLEQDFDPAVWEGVEDAVVGIAARITERRSGETNGG